MVIDAKPSLLPSWVPESREGRLVAILSSVGALGLVLLIVAKVFSSPPPKPLPPALLQLGRHLKLV